MNCFSFSTKTALILVFLAKESDYTAVYPTLFQLTNLLLIKIYY